MRGRGGPMTIMLTVMQARWGTARLWCGAGQAGHSTAVGLWDRVWLLIRLLLLLLLLLLFLFLFLCGGRAQSGQVRLVHFYLNDNNTLVSTACLGIHFFNHNSGKGRGGALCSTWLPFVLKPLIGVLRVLMCVPACMLGPQQQLMARACVCVCVLLVSCVQEEPAGGGDAEEPDYGSSMRRGRRGARGDVDEGMPMGTGAGRPSTSYGSAPAGRGGMRRGGGRGGGKWDDDDDDEPVIADEDEARRALSQQHGEFYSQQQRQPVARGGGRGGGGRGGRRRGRGRGSWKRMAGRRRGTRAWGSSVGRGSGHRRPWLLGRAVPCRAGRGSGSGRLLWRGRGEGRGGRGEERGGRAGGELGERRGERPRPGQRLGRGRRGSRRKRRTTSLGHPGRALSAGVWEERGVVIEGKGEGSAGVWTVLATRREGGHGRGGQGGGALQGGAGAATQGGGRAARVRGREMTTREGRGEMTTQGGRGERTTQGGRGERTTGGGRGERTTPLQGVAGVTTQGGVAVVVIGHRGLGGIGGGAGLTEAVCGGEGGTERAGGGSRGEGGMRGLRCRLGEGGGEARGGGGAEEGEGGRGVDSDEEVWGGDEAV